MQNVDYAEKDLLDGWFIEVKVNKEYRGNIRRTRLGTGYTYAYYAGEFNQMTVLRRSASLQGLKDDLVKNGYGA